jgi:hypothetical protein
MYIILVLLGSHFCILTPYIALILKLLFNRHFSQTYSLLHTSVITELNFILLLFNWTANGILHCHQMIITAASQSFLYFLQTNLLKLQVPVCAKPSIMVYLPNFATLRKEKKEKWDKDLTDLVILTIGLCILLRVYQLNIGITSVRNTVFLVLDFIVYFSHYKFRPRLAAIFRWFKNTRNIFKEVTIYSTDPLSRHV